MDTETWDGDDSAMDNTNPSRKEESNCMSPALAKMIVFGYIKGLIRMGRLEMAGKTLDEIEKESLFIMIANREKVGRTHQITHADDLLTEARGYAATGRPEFALIFYTTWFEHWLNGMYQWACARAGLDHAATERLIRTTNLDSKTDQMWMSTFHNEFPADAREALLRVAKARNEFVHYKWPVQYWDDPVGTAMPSELIESAETTVAALIKVEDEMMFDGRYNLLARHFGVSTDEDVAGGSG